MSTKKMTSNVITIFPEIAEKQYFQNPETKEFWFHATGACNSLGYKNVTSALSLHCDDDEKLMEIVNGKATWFVSESGFYGLAMGAKTEKAKIFKRWLKHDILPKLRSSGVVMTPSVTSEAIAHEWESQGKTIQQLTDDLTVLLDKQNILKAGAIYHADLLDIKSNATFAVLCVQTKNNDLHKKIIDLQGAMLIQYQNSSRYPARYWEAIETKKPEYRKYWLSQWSTGNQTYLNRAIGN